MYLIAGRPPEHVSPESLCEGPPRPPLDPESLCGSRPISRTTSAFALPGFGYTHGLSTQHSLPRYERLQAHSNDQGCNDLGVNCGVTRYDSLPPVSPKKQLFAEAVASADLIGANVRGPIRALSAPNMPMPMLLNGAQLQPLQSATPQLQAWGLTPLVSRFQSIDKTSATSGFGDADAASAPPALDTVSLPAQAADVIPIELASTNGSSGLHAAPDTGYSSAQSTDVVPSEMPRKNVHSGVLPLVGLEAVGAPAQSPDVMPAKIASDSMPSELLPLVALDTMGVSAQATGVMPAGLPSSTVHHELLQHADELDSSAPLLDDSQPSSFQLPPGLVWTKNDSFDDPNSDLQPEIPQNGASSSDVNHTD